MKYILGRCVYNNKWVDWRITLSKFHQNLFIYNKQALFCKWADVEYSYFWLANILWLIYLNFTPQYMMIVYATVKHILHSVEVEILIFMGKYKLENFLIRNLWLIEKFLIRSL